VDAPDDLRDIWIMSRQDGSSTIHKRSTMNSSDHSDQSTHSDQTTNGPDHGSAASSDAQPFRDPAHWKTGEEPITASQKSYLSTLATEAGEADQPVDALTKAEASIRIDELREKTGRGQ
jgi:hypothetical protein